MTEGVAARQVAYAILNDVFFQKKSLDEAYVRQQAGFDALEARDRAFVKLLCSIVLKRVAEMDARISNLLDNPLDTLRPPQMINIFRLGIAQFAFLQTPPHASVDTCVELAAAEGISHHKSLVNAVMRRLTREGYAHLDPREAGRVATPEWLWLQWVEDYGEDKALEIAAANLDEAPVDFTAKEDPQLWGHRLGAALLPTGSLRKEAGGFIPSLEGYEDGDWWVQNAAAALPALFITEPASKRIVDLCAAPGGKTAQLAAAGADVIALDRSPQRMKRLEENMERLRLNNVQVIIGDGAQWQPQEKVDAVLLDAPCTATGTIRHQPDVLLLKTLRDQDKLVALQRRLIENAAKMLESGGQLIYCTCSLQKAEGEEQYDWILAQDLSLTPMPIDPLDYGIDGISEMLTPRGEIRALPCHWKDRGGMDGFYVAKFVKD